MAALSRQDPCFTKPALLLIFLAASVSNVMAQSCISLSGSTECSAFNRSSISTDAYLTSLFPFLTFVSDTTTFDKQLRQYIATGYSQQKYQQLIGCSSVDLTNTTELYARYTTSFLCNAIVQNSVRSCRLSGVAARPLCADSCAQWAISEQNMASSPEICGTPGPNALSQIRADFTNCALPADSLSGACITGAENEPNDCGFDSNLTGLCAFCAASSPNSTDSCCLGSQAETRCTNVHLPVTTPMAPLFPNSTSTSSSTSRATSAPTATGAASQNGITNAGLTGGQIAGIVVGSVVGALVLLALLICCCVVLRRRRRGSEAGSSVLNLPSPTREPAPPPMTYAESARQKEILPSSRIARMSALEGTSSSSPQYSSPNNGEGYGQTSSDEYDDTPDSQPTPPKRHGSLSSHSALAVGEEGSPRSNEQYSSPEGLASGQSEQLHFFKDYYSQDEIRPGDTVATLWAYQPRANDEFELERGDMLKIVGIWDDGWATGVKLRESADQWEARRHGHRDSGVSNGSSRRPTSGSGDASGEIKAFPLVCVCMPRHWRKTIEGDTTESSTSMDQQDRHDQPPPGSP